jgi:hypothetical protein
MAKQKDGDNVEKILNKEDILSAVQKLDTAENRIAKNQEEIINGVIERMLNIPHATRIAIIDDALKSFPPAAKKRGGEGNTRYQYATRLKAIVGAKFLVPEFQIRGGINFIHRMAVDALKKAGKNFLGESVEQTAAAKEEQERAKLEAEITAKATKNLPPDTPMGELRKHVEKEVNEVLARRMLEKFQAAAERDGQRLIDTQGKEVAIAYAQAYLKFVSSDQAKPSKEAPANVVALGAAQV